MTKTTVEPTPITSKAKATKPELTPQEKLALLPPAQQDMLKEKAHAVDPTKPKSKRSWKERLAEMSPEHAAKARAKAAEASRISKAKKKETTPVIATAMRLKAQLARNIERTELLEAERAKIEAELAEIEARLAADQTETEADKNGQA